MQQTDKHIISDDLKQRIREFGARYPDVTSGLIPALWAVQNEFGHILPGDMEVVAEILGIHRAQVKSVQSFYSMYMDKKVGENLIQICRSISCMLNGSDELLEQIKEYLVINEGETTEDGKFTLFTVECLGACGGAPVIQFNWDYHENLTWEKTKEIIDGLRSGTINTNRRNEP